MKLIGKNRIASIVALRKKGVTLKKIGEMFGTSKQRVFQLLNPLKQKAICFYCKDTILPPVIYARINYQLRKKMVSLDYGCGEKMFNLGKLKLNKGRNKK